MSLKSIKENDRLAAIEAARKNKRPLVVTLDDWHSDLSYLRRGLRPPHLRKLPPLAPEYVESLYPGQYQHVESFFTDRIGFDLFNSFGPALSIGELVIRGITLTESRGALAWSIHDEGQFQLYVSCYKMTGGNGRQAESAKVLKRDMIKV